MTINRRSRYIIVTYGFFLVWLLSFLYNGPTLSYVFHNTKVDITYLSMTYVLVPALICLSLSRFTKESRNSIQLMQYGIIVSLIGTLFLIFFKGLLNAIIVYTIAGLLGISSILFIAGWGVLFVRFITFKTMMKTMGLMICLGKGIFTVNEILCSYHLEIVSIIIIFASLILSYYYTYKLNELRSLCKDKTRIHLDYDKHLLLVVCFTMFFSNVGGGFTQTLFVSIIKNAYIHTFFMDLILYISVFFIILHLKEIKNTQIIMTTALTLLGIGFILFITFSQNIIITYVITSLAYLIIDILIWSIVGKIGYMFGKPLKVFFAVMAYNLIAVFIGNVLGLYFSRTKQYMYISICAICILLTFSFCQILYKKMNFSVSQFKAINQIRDITMDLFTAKEKEIMGYMLKGHKNKEIADKAAISENTLKTHARNIYAKAGVNNKKELIALVKEEN